MAPLGVQLYSVRQQLADDRRGTLQRIADLGYQSVEPFDLLTDPGGLRALTNEFNLSIGSAHAPVHGERRDELLDAAAEISLDTLIVPAIAPAEFADRSGVEGVAATLNETAAKAAERGISVGYHNHYWEISSTVDDQYALEFLAGLLAPEVFLEVDVYWAHVGGADVPALLRRLGGKVRFLHVKDGPGTREDPMTAVGSGVVPIPAILDAAPDAGRIVELDECATDMFEALDASRRYLAGLA
jgi:sugar phosphate isomerase/epimerase